RAAGLRLYRHARPSRPRHADLARRVRPRPVSFRLYPFRILGTDAHLSLFPDPAHGGDHHPRRRWIEARMERGRPDAWREQMGFLALCRPADPLAVIPWNAFAALRQRIRRHRHRLGADRVQSEHRHRAALQPDPRRRFAKPGPRGRPRDRHGRYHLHRQHHLSRGRQAGRKVDEMRQNRLWAWVIVSLAAVYFFVPLLATFIFSLRMRRGELSFDAYASVFSDPQFFSSFGYSLAIGAFTIVLGVLVVVPAVYYVRLRMPWLRPVMEFVTLLPLVIPALVLVYGYIRLYGSSSFIPFTGSVLGTDILLTCAYVTLALPYMYRAVDNGMRTIDIGTLTEAAQIAGANQLQIIGWI